MAPQPSRPRPRPGPRPTERKLTSLWLLETLKLIGQHGALGDRGKRGGKRDGKYFVTETSDGKFVTVKFDKPLLSLAGRRSGTLLSVFSR